jgi:hypothetical protein
MRCRSASFVALVTFEAVIEIRYNTRDNWRRTFRILRRLSLLREI